jgi:hypothetical protein
MRFIVRNDYRIMCEVLLYLISYYVWGAVIPYTHENDDNMRNKRNWSSRNLKSYSGFLPKDKEI